MTFNEALATRINELLKEKDMTQYRLAMNSGVVAQSIDNKIGRASCRERVYVLV